MAFSLSDSLSLSASIIMADITANVNLSNSSTLSTSNSSSKSNSSQKDSFCVQKPGHSSEMMQELVSILKEQALCDVTLSTDTGSIDAHQLILSAASPYFRQLFTRLRLPNQYPVIFITDMPYEDLQAILDFVYTGQLVMPASGVDSLLKSAQSLKIKSILDLNLDQSGGGDGGKQSKDTGEVVVKKRSKGKHKRQKVDSLTSHNESSSFVKVKQEPVTSDSDTDTTIIDGQKEVFSEYFKTFKLDNSIEQGCPSDYWSPNLEPNVLLSLPDFSDLQDEPSVNLNTIDSSYFNGQNEHKEVDGGGGGSSSIVIPASAFMKPKLTWPRDENQKFFCDICGQGFTAKRNLQRHIIVHNSRRDKYCCELCKKQFSWKHTLKIHMKDAHKIKSKKAK